MILALCYYLHANWFSSHLSKTWVGLIDSYGFYYTNSIVRGNRLLPIHVCNYLCCPPGNTVWNKSTALSLKPLWWRVIPAILLGKINYLSNRFISGALNEIKHSLMLCAQFHHLGGDVTMWQSLVFFLFTTFYCLFWFICYCVLLYFYQST